MTLQGKHIAIALRGVVDERTKKLAQALASAGADVSIYAYTFNREQPSEQPYRVIYRDSVEPKGSSIPWRLLRIGVNLTIKKIAFLVRSYVQGTFGYKKIADDLVAAKPDMLVAINADTLMGVARAARQLNVPFVYETFEFWPDHVKETAVYYSAAERAFILEHEKSCAREALFVVTVSDYLAQQYQKEFDLKSKPRVIYNAPLSCTSEVSPVHQPLKVLFLGNIQQERNVEYLVRAVAQTENVELTFIGKGPYRAELEKLADKLGIAQRVVFKEPVPYARVAQAASHYDVGVVCHQTYNRQMEGALPNKFFEYMAGGLAVVAPESQAFKSFENFDTFGLFIDTGDERSLAAVLRQLTRNSQEVFERKQSALREAQKYCGAAREEAIVMLYESGAK